MTSSEPDDRPLRAIRVWLWLVAGLVFVMIIVGGATRLTESGLSIVEWKPVTGTLPPLSEAQWQAEFDKYKTIPQYQKLNQGMSLGDFKTIFWWEWGHRLLGRLIGAAFLLPFVYFLARGFVRERKLRARLWGLFALGGLQGAVGWWMVASGLAERTEVSQYRLAAHLLLASVIYVALIWTAERCVARPSMIRAPRLRATAALFVVAVLAQIYLGALVAGLRAGKTYNTWPWIDGAIIPPSDQLLAMAPAWRNAFENALTVQFDHRVMAYLLLALAIAHAFDAARAGTAAGRAWGLAGLTALQAVIGIVTLLYVVPIGWALLHQGVAFVLLAAAVVHLERLSPTVTAAGAGAPQGART